MFRPPLVRRVVAQAGRRQPLGRRRNSIFSFRRRDKLDPYPEDAEPSFTDLKEANVFVQQVLRSTARGDHTLVESEMATGELHRMVTWTPLWFVGTVALGFGWVLSPFSKDTDVGRWARKTEAWRWLVAQMGEMSRPFADPAREKLLPDWPFFPNLPPDTPCPPTLVLDVEGTLVQSAWDPKHGWRHVKRPGVEKFLREMSRYYEIVFFTSNPITTTEPILNALDKDQHVWHRLYRESTRFINGAHVKDLSHLNRNIKKIIVIDDDPKAFQLQPQNAIRVDTFTAAMLEDDHVLEDLIPFLVALVNERVSDFPAVLSSFKSNDGKQIGLEYNSKLASIKERQETRGLGGLLRSSGPTFRFDQTAAPAEPEVKIDLSSGAASGSISSAGSVGDDPRKPPPAPAKKKGALWQRLDTYQKESEEDQRRRMEKFQEVAQQKERERREQEQQQKA